MRKASENKLLSRFSESVGKDEFIPDLRLTFRIVGGMPHERLDHSIVLEASGAVKVRYEDRMKGIGPVTREGVLDRKEALEFMKNIVQGQDQLVFESEATFLPDALTGRLTLETGGKSETFWFGVAGPDDGIEDEIAEGYHFARKMTKAIQDFERISTKLLKRQGK